MKVHRIQKTSPAAQVAEVHATPIKAEPLPEMNFTDSMSGMLLANEVLGTLKTQAGSWQSFAIRLIKMNIESRASFMKSLREGLNEMKKANTLDGGIDAKLAAKRVNSATVVCSMLNTIAKAFNAGATIEGLCEYSGASVTMWEAVGYTIMTEYSRAFLKANASGDSRGRKITSFLTKLQKWVEAHKAEAINDEDAAVVDHVVGLIQKDATEFPDLLPQPAA